MHTWKSLNKKKIRGYHLGHSLGRGAFSEVFLARREGKTDKIALKVMNLETLPHDEKGFRYDLFLREAQMLQNLSHPGIPEFIEFFIQDDLMILAMEYVPGVNLEYYIEQNHGKLPPDQALDIAIQLSHILEYLHTGTGEHPVIYRDLKPSNVIIDPNGKARLIDFATAREYSPKKTADTVRLGTPGYASPEAYGTGQTDPRADVYSLAATLLQLVTGKSPGDFPLPTPPARELDPGVDKKIEKVISLGMAPLSRRIQGAARFREILLQVRHKLDFESLPWGKIVTRLSEIYSNKIKNPLKKLGAIPALALILIFLALPPAVNLMEGPASKSRKILPVTHSGKGDLKFTGTTDQGALFKLSREVNPKIKGHGPELYAAWERFRNFKAFTPADIRAKMDLYPAVLKQALKLKINKLAQKVIIHAFEDCEKHLDREPGFEPKVVVDPVLKTALANREQFDFIISFYRYVSSGPVISNKRKIFVGWRAARQVEMTGKRKQALKMMNFMERYARRINRYSKGLGVKYAAGEGYWFILGEIQRMKGNRKNAFKFYNIYLAAVDSREDPENLKYHEFYREKLFRNVAVKRLNKIKQSEEK